MSLTSSVDQMLGKPWFLTCCFPLSTWSRFPQDADDETEDMATAWKSKVPGFAR